MTVFMPEEDRPTFVPSDYDSEDDIPWDCDLELPDYIMPDYEEEIDNGND
jgi:hypothetical protein